MVFNDFHITPSMPEEVRVGAWCEPDVCEEWGLGLVTRAARLHESHACKPIWPHPADAAGRPTHRISSPPSPLTSTQVGELYGGQKLPCLLYYTQASRARF